MNSKVVWCFFLLAMGSAIGHVQTNAYQATAQQKAALKKQADDMAAAMTAQNYQQLAYYTYPPIIKAMGGKDNVMARVKNLMDQMQSQGIAFKSATIGDIKDIVKSGHDLYSIVPDIIQMSINGNTITQGTYLLAISKNNGIRWYFIDTATLKKHNIKALLPTYPTGLVIPDVQKPGFMQSN